MKIVVAFGGNAILRKGQKGTADEQKENILKTCREVAKLIQEGHKVIITHGNGPQVGNILIQQKEASDIVAPQPMDIAGAMSQGQLGYLIQQILRNITGKESITFVTEVLVDENDPAFKNPTKPVGPFYEEKISEDMVYDSGRGYRKVVPSPVPVEILGVEAVKRIIEDDTVVIAAGGGGIPVVKDRHGKFRGVEAVIDKDRASQVLAN
ncbi:carbamate kinase, partial [Candidatus Micrarchaeota archaeon]|nr:carbamate kinase [Candidatus Micrarchaeota archaeon]